MVDMFGTNYDDKAVTLDTEESLESAQVVVPIIMNLLHPQKVIDFGCGHGAWLKVFQDHDVRTILGLDGSYVVPSHLLIDRSSFRAVDLTQRWQLNGDWDLALCLEVAEHLPREASWRLVRALTKAAPLVLFSAAVPGQQGTGHVNEQWPDYWKSLFARRGFRRLDPFRPRIWQDGRVAWWYRQNMFLFASDETIAKSDFLRTEEERIRGPQLELLHASVLSNHVDGFVNRENALDARDAELQAVEAALNDRERDLQRLLNSRTYRFVRKLSWLLRGFRSKVVGQ
jgi:hypothetical protein